MHARVLKLGIREGCVCVLVTVELGEVDRAGEAEGPDRNQGDCLICKEISRERVHVCVCEPDSRSSAPASRFLSPGFAIHN